MTKVIFVNSNSPFGYSDSVRCRGAIFEYNQRLIFMPLLCSLTIKVTSLNPTKVIEISLPPIGIVMDQLLANNGKLDIACVFTDMYIYLTLRKSLTHLIGAKHFYSDTDHCSLCGDRFVVKCWQPT